MPKRKASVEVAAISYAGQFLVLSDETEVDFGTMFDQDGEETDDVEQACCCVAQLPDGDWLTVDFTAFEPVTIH